ncbi:hypothetical protein SASPL_123292 [Salvia splendens]|uniref:FLZ-type domain-containing protein n=1 Tax=Salvia splendens TaxID=180675 RepID=A0A8X8ZT20_SALSN|nr:FCS-Like Zinc finger 17-like [Salvia splendens]KAG6415873.1 hypothetical protein SASPL_123292 [Salvia splendens]
MFAEIWSKKKPSINTNCEGLRFFTKIEISNSNVVVNPIFLLKPQSKSPNPHNCYLKLCHLCVKPLNFDKEIFMYKGDLGFCSVECRDRQIYMDETQQMEANTKRILSTFRQRHGGGRCETAKLLEDFRRPFSPPSERVVFSYS